MFIDFQKYLKVMVAERCFLYFLSFYTIFKKWLVLNEKSDVESWFVWPAVQIF